MFHPSRGGVRGGQDQFSWDNVKEDKYRENYLGHSLKAPVGRWQKGKDLTWYAKNGNERDEARAAELRAIKEAEEEAMLEALGYPSKKKSNTALIDAKELNTILHKGNHAGEEETDKESFEVKGLGYKDSSSKSLTGKTETTKFTSSATIPSNLPTVSSKQRSVMHTNEETQQEGAQSDTSISPKKQKDKKHKKSKSKSKKKRHDSDDENISEIKRHKSSRSKIQTSPSLHSRDKASRYIEGEHAERSYSSRDRHKESTERIPRSSYRVNSREDRPTRYRSRSPRREDSSHRRSSRY